MAHILLESRGREAPEGECNIEPLHSSLYNNLLVVGAYLYGKLCNSSQRDRCGSFSSFLNIENSVSPKRLIALSGRPGESYVALKAKK